MAVEFRLRELMKERGYTYREVEAGSGVSKSILTKMANQKQRRTDLEVLDRLTNFLGCDISDLLVKVKEN